MFLGWEFTLLTTNSFIDCLAHLDDARLVETEEVLQRAQEAGCRGIINGGVDPLREDWDRLRYSNDFPRIYRAFGIHPLAAGRAPLHEHLIRLRTQLAAGPSVAVGEIGLDSRPGLPASALQEEAFLAQLDIAEEFKLPVILHCVRSHGRMAQILRSRGQLPFGGMVHGFTGSWEVAQDYLSVGLSLSFGGLVTRPNSKKAQDTAARIPLDRMLLESDTPDHPASGWGPEQSEPASVSYIIQYLAQLRGQSPEEISRATKHNAEVVFRLNAGA